MKRLLLCLIFLPVFASAGIPVVTPVTIGNLTPLDGRSFSSSVIVQMDGDEIAVFDPADNSFGTGHGSVYFFAQQSGSWRQTAKLEPPGGTEGVFRGFSFHDDVVVVSIKASIVSIDGARLRSFVLERANGVWTQTLVLPEFVTGPVSVRGNWMAVPRRKGIEMFQHLGFGNWQSAGELTEEGFSYLFEALAGPAYDFDGRRILIGTDLSQLVTRDDGGQASYFQVAARLYQLDDSGQWTLAQRLVTDQVFDSVSVRPEFVSLSGRDLSILGLVYRDNGYGYWEQAADLTPVSTAWITRLRVEMLGNALSWVASEDGTRRDLYAQDGNGFWQPRLRLASGSPTIVASQGSLAVGAFVTPNVIPRQPGTAVLSLIDVPALAAQAHAPAHISNIEVGKPWVQPQDTTTLSAWVYTGGAGNAVRGVEYRDAAGAWQPMSAGDGRFDSPSESAWAVAAFPDQLYAHARLCLRVTDIAGRQTEMLDRQEEPCPVVVGRDPTPAIIHVPDDQPPEVETPLLAYTQLQFGQQNVIYAFADDWSSGEHYFGQFDFVPSTILAMQWRIDDGVWRAMKPFPNFGEIPTEYSSEMRAAYGNFPPATELGHHTACVRAMDSFGNLSLPACVGYEVGP